MITAGDLAVLKCGATTGLTLGKSSPFSSHTRRFCDMEEGKNECTICNKWLIEMPVLPFRVKENATEFTNLNARYLVAYSALI
jgi:hypothetical protein